MPSLSAISPENQLKTAKFSSKSVKFRQILAARRAPRQIPSNSVKFPSNSRQIPDPARAPPSNSVKFWRPAGPSVKSVKSVKFRQIFDLAGAPTITLWQGHPKRNLEHLLMLIALRDVASTCSTNFHCLSFPLLGRDPPRVSQSGQSESHKELNPDP